MKTFEFDKFRFDPSDGRLSTATESAEVHLRPQAGKLLCRLLDTPQTVVDRATLIRAIWDKDTVVDFESGLAALLREVRLAIQALDGDAGLIETVPRRGYRLRAQVRNRDGTGLAVTMPERGRRASRRPAVIATVLIIALALLVAAALAAIDWWRDPAVPADTAQRPRQLAILPLERFGDRHYPPARADILLADGILAALWRAELENLELIGRAGMRPYAGREDVVSMIASDLGVDLLMEGSIRVSSGSWQVDLRLLEVPPGRVVWSQTLDGSDPALPTDEIANEIVAELGDAWPRLRKALNSG